jgi:2,3-diketo-5-methylthio-1-phosphopentane phosphatase
MIRVFLDFDGTSAINDVGDEFFIRFGKFHDIIPVLLRGEITVAEYYRQSCAVLEPTLTPDDVTAWAQTQDLDPWFSAFVNWCGEQNIPVTIASDGFRNYIEPILTRSGHADLDVACNSLDFDGTRFTPRFPGATESCSCFCASCKRNAVLLRSAPDDIIVHVGDGMSDACVAEHADIVFAKDSLAAYCTRERIPHHPFTTLFDVMRILKDKISRNDIRPRHQARLARMRAFAAE